MLHHHLLLKKAGLLRHPGHLPDTTLQPLGKDNQQLPRKVMRPIGRPMDMM